jgi:predicted hydrolase (HD superfamily)
MAAALIHPEKKIFAINTHFILKLWEKQSPAKPTGNRSNYAVSWHWNWMSLLISLTSMKQIAVDLGL